MLFLLFSLVLIDADQQYLPPINDETYKVCLEVETELSIAVESNLISLDEVHDILDNCYHHSITTL